MMRKQDAMMFGLYLIAIALGVNMMGQPDSYGIGLFQVVFVASFFALRLWTVFGRRKDRP